MDELRNNWNAFLGMIENENLRKRMDSFMDKGNKSAATDVRKFLLEIGAACKNLRANIQEVKNAQ